MRNRLMVVSLFAVAGLLADVVRGSLLLRRLGPANGWFVLATAIPVVIAA